jgi:hypothetical protein
MGEGTVSHGLGFDTRLYDLAMKRIGELEQELIYARRAELVNEEYLKRAETWEYRARRLGWTVEQEDD